MKGGGGVEGGLKYTSSPLLNDVLTPNTPSSREIDLDGWWMKR